MTADSSRFACPACGQLRTAAHCWECDTHGGETRGGFLELAATAVTTAALLPFLQALASKAGEDVWLKIADLIRPGRRKEISERVADAELIELVAPDRRLIITLPRRLSAESARHLHDVVDTLREADGYYRLVYDAASRTWEIIAVHDEHDQFENRQPDD